MRAKMFFPVLVYGLMALAVPFGAVAAGAQGDEQPGQNQAVGTGEQGRGPSA